MDSGWFVASYVVLWVLVVVSLLLWIALTRQIGILHSRWGPRGALLTEDGPEIGSSLPELHLTSVAGTQIDLPKDQLMGLAVVVNAECSACDELIPAIGTLIKDPPGAIHTLVLVADEVPETAREFVSRHDLDPRAVAAAPDVSSLLNISSTPFALVVDGEGKVLNKGIANSLEQLEVLIAQARSAEVGIREETERDRGLVAGAEV